MKIQLLREMHFILYETKCAIYNTLNKFRPDLRDAMQEIPGRDVKASVEFLKKNNLWDDEADGFLHELMMYSREYHRGPDEHSRDAMMAAQERLMCHVAKLIRDSAKSKD